MDKIEKYKEIILEQAFASFIQKGPKNFTVDALAVELGMSKKTIYGIFPTKEILIENIFENFTASIRKEFEEIINSEENPIIKFNTIIDSLTNKFVLIPITSLMELKIRYPLIWERLANFREEMSKNFAQFFKDAQKQGLAKSDIDMEKAASIFLYIINNTIQPEFFIANDIAPSDGMKLLVRMITEGLLTEEGVVLRNKT